MNDGLHIKSTFIDLVKDYGNLEHRGKAVLDL